MPELDVSFLLSDPMLSDFITISRRGDTVDSKGRTTTTVTQVFENVSAVVTLEAPAMTERAEDREMTPKKIFGATGFAIRGETIGSLPDLVSWSGTDYLVTQVLPYSRFGQGTYEFVAQTFAAVDPLVDENT